MANKVKEQEQIKKRNPVKSIKKKIIKTPLKLKKKIKSKASEKYNSLVEFISSRKTWKILTFFGIVAFIISCIVIYFLIPPKCYQLIKSIFIANKGLYDEKCYYDFHCDISSNLTCEKHYCKCTDNRFWSNNLKNCEKCPWTVIGSECVNLNNNAKTWSNAQIDCIKENSILLILKKKDELRRKYEDSSLNFDQSVEYWVGALKKKDNNFNWFPDQISWKSFSKNDSDIWCNNTNNILKNVEYCITISRQNRLCLNYAQCNTTKYYACQKF